MNARQRGACWLLLAILAGRILDVLDLPFEHGARSAPETTARVPEPSSAVVPAATPAAARTSGPPAAPAPESAETAPTADTPLQVNEATEEELQALPGVGPVLAQRIVAFRDEHGDFRDAASLRQVKGIGARLAARLAPLLRFH